MKVDCLPIGLYGENSYILHEKGHVLFVDPGRYADKIASKVDPKESVDAIVLTHGHEDHTGAVDDLADRYACPVFLSEKDRFLTDPALAGQYGFSAPVYTPVQSYQSSMTIGIFSLKIYETPGHTPGSVCIQYRNLLFSGDTLFASSCGRTDLPGGSEQEMFRSLFLLAQLPNDLRVLPGHDTETTIGMEKINNIYMREAIRLLGSE